MNQMRKFRKQSLKRKIIFIEALFWLLATRMSIGLIPFRHVVRFLEKIAPRHASARPSPAVLTDIGWALRTAGRHAPWRSECLVRAMSGQIMLVYRGINSAICLGIAHDGPHSLRAHAWLTCGDLIVVGEEGMPDYITMLCIGEAT